MDGAGVGHHVDELAGIESAGGRGGDVADVVGTGALRGEAEVGEFHQDFRAMPGHDFADLEVGAGGQVGVAGTPFSGDFRKSPKLVGAERSAGDAAAEHEAFLRRGDEKKAVELVAKHIAIDGEAVGFGVGEDGVVAIEAVLLVLDPLLAAELVDGSAVDCFDGLRGLVGEAVFRVLPEEREIARLQDARDESGKVGGLLLAES